MSDRTKCCSKCKEDKLLIEFNKSKNSKDGHGHWCRKCNSIYNSEWNKNNREWYRNRYKNNTEHIKDQQRKRKRGITGEQFRKMVSDQNGVCYICCGKEMHNRSIHLCVDHCHETGKIRGLLCNNCNRCLGLAKDDPQILRNMADYLETRQTKSASI